jgi:hypothetical protein
MRTDPITTSSLQISQYIRATAVISYRMPASCGGEDLSIYATVHWGLFNTTRGDDLLAANGISSSATMLYLPPYFFNMPGNYSLVLTVEGLSGKLLQFNRCLRCSRRFPLFQSMASARC